MTSYNPGDLYWTDDDECITVDEAVRRAYDEGYQSFMMGYSQDICPYSVVDGILLDAWHDGFKQLERDDI